MTNHETARRERVEYFVQCQQPDGAWEQASSTATDLDFATERLAARRRMRPEFVYRIAQRTTVVVVGPVEAAAVSVPPPAPRADDLRCAVLREVADWFDSGIRSVSQMFGHQAATALRRMADEAQPARLDRCPHGCDTSTCPCLACEADEVEQPGGPCVAGEQQNETPEAVEHMLARMRADAATDSLDGLLRIIADWYRSSEGRDVLFEDLIAAGYRLPERASE